jgi:threonine aldolase
MVGYLEKGLWHELAQQANNSATYLTNGLRGAGMQFYFNHKQT